MRAYSRMHIIDSLKIPFFTVLLLFIIHVIKVLTHIQFGLFGIFPRDVRSLPGIFTSPFIHGSFEHLFSNILPLFATMFIILLFYKRIAIRSILLIYLLTGISVWIGARPAFHIGASGVVYGLVSFIFWLGIFRRNMKSIALALIVLIMYSGYIAGIIPNTKGISWESHLFGGFIGIFVAYLYRGEIEHDEVKKRYDWQDTKEIKAPFLSPDAFEKTKEQRVWDQNFDQWTQNNT